MTRHRLMVLSAAFTLIAGAGRAEAQAVVVDVGIASPGLDARIVWGAPPPVVVYEPVVVYGPVPVRHYPAPVRIVYYQTLPSAYWAWVRVHDPYLYAQLRHWADYERAYDRAWRLRDRARYEELRAREHRYFHERAAVERHFRAWTVDRRGDRDRDHRARGRGRGRW